MCKALLTIGVLVCSATVAVGQPTQAPPAAAGAVPEPRLVTRIIDRAGGLLGESKRRNDGWFATFDSIARGGWLAAGGGYRHHFWGTHARFESSAAISMRRYTEVRGSFELPRLASDRLVAGVTGLHRDLTQVAYFGLGPDSRNADRADYRLTTTEMAVYGDYRVRRTFTVRGAVGWLARPRVRPSTGPFDRDDPDVITTFATDPAVRLAHQPGFVSAGLSATLDTRDATDHPSRGALYRLAATSFHDRDHGRFNFRRYESEAMAAVPILRDRLTLAVHGWAVASGVSEDDEVPFYLMPSLGGGNTLRAYPSFRFHDRNTLLLSAEARFALFMHFDLAAFVDAGTVARHTRDLDLSRRSYGLGIRAHVHSFTLARMDVAHGTDGYRLVLSLSDPFGLSRLVRRVGVAPFVP
jgi:outer membrane protein assembly factor BamA